MTPDATPERNTAAQEARLAANVRGEALGPTYWTLGNVLVIVLGFALAFGLALLVLHP